MGDIVYRYLAMENHHFEWVDVGVGFDGSRVSKMLWSSSQIPKERPLQRLCSTQDHVHMLFVIMPKQIIRFRKSMVWPTPFAVFPWALLYVPACSGANGSCTGLEMALVLCSAPGDRKLSSARFGVSNSKQIELWKIPVSHPITLVDWQVSLLSPETR